MRFEKISFMQFVCDMKQTACKLDELNDLYENAVMPRRATKKSAGYDILLSRTSTSNPERPSRRRPGCALFSTKTNS